MFKNVFNYKSPNKMLEYLHSSETVDDYNKAAFLNDESFINFGDEIRYKSKIDEKTREI